LGSQECEVGMLLMHLMFPNNRFQHALLEFHTVSIRIENSGGAVCVI